MLVPFPPFASTSSGRQTREVSLHNGELHPEAQRRLRERERERVRQRERDWNLEVEAGESEEKGSLHSLFSHTGLTEPEVGPGSERMRSAWV